MRWLLWKDYRHNRLIVWTALALLLAPHLLALYATCRAGFLGLPHAWHWQDAFLVSSVYSLGISQLAVALIGGNAIAGERADRSAEFLFSLPIARRRLLASKLLLTVCVASVAWLVNVPVLCYLAGNSGLGEYGRLCGLFTTTAITGMTFFCVAWFVSSFLASPAYAACGGLLTPLLVSSGIFFVEQMFELRFGPRTFELWYRGICLVLAPPLFALGTWHYLRRIEP